MIREPAGPFARLSRLVGRHHLPAPSQSSPGVPPIHCGLFAAPGGSDSAGNGSISRPNQTLMRLDSALTPGQTGCLRGGTYGSLSTMHTLTTSGTAAARITIASTPGETATVVGWIHLEGAYTTISHLRIDGSNTFLTQAHSGQTCRRPASQWLGIAGHDDVLESDNYFQSVASLRGNGIGIGGWGNVDNTIIRYNKIHDVGGCDFYDHLIYLAEGRSAQIYGNWLWNDAHGWGIKLDPGPSYARIWGNVIEQPDPGSTSATATAPIPPPAIWSSTTSDLAGDWSVQSQRGAARPLRPAGEASAPVRPRAGEPRW